MLHRHSFRDSSNSGGAPTPDDIYTKGDDSSVASTTIRWSFSPPSESPGTGNAGSSGAARGLEDALPLTRAAAGLKARPLVFVGPASWDWGDKPASAEQVEGQPGVNAGAASVSVFLANPLPSNVQLLHASLNFSAGEHVLHVSLVHLGGNESFRLPLSSLLLPSMLIADAKEMDASFTRSADEPRLLWNVTSAESGRMEGSKLDTRCLLQSSVPFSPATSKNIFITSKNICSLRLTLKLV
jgi:hypothetical protein